MLTNSIARRIRATNPPARRHARTANLSTGAKIAIVAGAVIVGVPLVLITVAALGFRSLVRQAEQDMPSRVPHFEPSNKPKWLYWTEPGPGGYGWDAWVQRPDGAWIKATATPVPNELEATSMALTLIRDNGGSPLLSTGRPY